jgi:hypothetical protein
MSIGRKYLDKKNKISTKHRIFDLSLDVVKPSSIKYITRKEIGSIPCIYLIFITNNLQFLAAER